MFPSPFPCPRGLQMQNFRIFLLLLTTPCLWAGKSEYKFSFGAIADCQYCQGPDRGSRKYKASQEKLKQCVEHFNQENLSFVIHLGDFIDRDFSSFDDLLPIYQSLHAPGYHVLGNHDFEVADEYKKQVP